MCFTVMTLDNSKHCHLEQILFSLELSRYQGLTVFIPGILDKGKFKRKFVLILDTENITDVLEKISWFNLEAFTFENMKISLKAFINLTHRARETPYGAHNCFLRIPDIPIWCLCVVALNPRYPHMTLRTLQQTNNHLQFDWLIFDNSKQFFDCLSVF